MSGARIGSGIGAVLGAFVTATTGNPILGALIAAAGGAIGSAVDPVQLDDIEIGRIDNDIDLTTAQLGTPIPWVWGLGPVTGKLNFSPGIKEEIVEETEGGKGAPEQTTRTFFYNATLGLILCRGPAELIKIYREGDLILDRAATSGPMIDTDFLAGFDAYDFVPGDFDQLPDPIEQAEFGIDATPAYRGIARLVLYDFDITDLGRVPTIRCEIATGSLTNLFVQDSLATSLGALNDDFIFLISNDGRTGILIQSLTLVQIDLISKTETLKTTITGADSFPDGDFDALGNFYAPKLENVLAINSSVVKYDSFTFDIIGKTQLFNDPPPQNGLLTDGSEELRVIGFAPSTQIVISRSQFGTIDVIRTQTREQDTTFEDYPRLPILKSHSLNDLVAGSSHQTRGMTVDSDGNCWIIANDAIPAPDTTTIVMIEPVFGDIELLVSGVAIDLSSGQSAVAYDDFSHSLIIYDGSNLYRWDITTESLVGTPLALSTDGQEHRNAFRVGPTNGEMWIPQGISTTNTARVDVVNLVILETVTDASYPSGAPLQNGFHDAQNNAIIKKSGITLFWNYLGRVSGGATTLKVIYDDISDEVGFAAGEVTTTELAAETVEFAHAKRRQPARRFMESLARLHFVRLRPKDFGIEFIKRGQTPSFALTEADLGAIPSGDEPIERLSERFKDPVELPHRVDIKFLSRPDDYEIEEVPTTKPPETGDIERVEEIEYPGVMLADVARQAGDITLNAAYTAADEADAQLTYDKLRIDPGDVGTVDEGGIVRTMEVQRVEFGNDWIPRLELKGEDDNDFVSASSSADGVGKPSRIINVSSATQLFAIDGPAPQPSDDLFRMLFAGPTGVGTNWRGTRIEQSPNGVDNWTLYAIILPNQKCTWGRLTAALPVGPTTIFDKTNTLSVKLATGSISSVTEDQLRADEDLNPFFVLGSNGWEYGQFATAALQADGTYDLTTLRRGRRNTENYMDGHTINQPIIFPTNASTIIKTFDRTDINITTPEKTYFRAVELSGLARSPIEHEIIGRSKKPWSPTKLAISVSANDLTITWTRRSRDGKSLSFSSVPIGEDIHDYVLEILDAFDGNVVRTITSTASGNGSVITVNANGGSCFYDDADQIIDFTVVQTTVHVRIYQLSDLVAGFRGEPAKATLSV